MKMNVMPANAIERKAASDRAAKMKNKLALSAMSAACSAMLIANAAITAHAEEGAGGDALPAGVQTAKMSSLLDIVFWVIRIIVLIVGGVSGIPKIVQGQADENPRDRNNGLAVIAIAGAAFGATFAIRNLI